MSTDYIYLVLVAGILMAVAVSLNNQVLGAFAMFVYFGGLYIWMNKE